MVFPVFFNTFEGAGSVDRFASLTPAVSFALIGVIVGEFIGGEHGIGRLIIEAEARGEAAGMMVAIFVLMIVGIILAALVRRLQAYLLRWRPAQQAAIWQAATPALPSIAR